MDYFHSIKDSDIFENPVPEPKEYKARPTVKGFVFDAEDKIALLCHPDEDYGLLPGGGMEEGETPEQAFIRECKEEIGCNIEILSKVGVALQQSARDSRLSENHFFVARVLGEKGVPTTKQDDEMHTIIKWMNVRDLEEQLRKQIAFTHENWYRRQFNSRTHYAALQKYLKDKDN